MEFTGERVIPGQVNADLWAEHFSRYHLATQYAKNADILDIGCGTGYGTAHLARTARRAIGIDPSHEAIEHARAQYPDATYIQASATALPFDHHSYDLITAFEVIEHIKHWPNLISEAKRLLRPSGTFLVSTPNKDYYAESRATSGPNPYHVHEFSYHEFQQALQKEFPLVTILLQNPVAGFVFATANPKDQTLAPTATIEATPPQPELAYFYLAVCTHHQTEIIPPNIYIPRTSNVLREREHHIRLLRADLQKSTDQYNTLARAQTELEQHLVNQNNWAKTLDSQLAEARDNITKLQQHLEQQNNWATGLDRELQDARAYLTRLQADFAERTSWALSLNDQLQTTHAHLAKTQENLEQRTRQINLISSSRWYRMGRKLNLGPNLDANE